MTQNLKIHNLEDQEVVFEICLRRIIVGYKLETYETKEYEDHFTNKGGKFK